MRRRSRKYLSPLGSLGQTRRMTRFAQSELFAAGPAAIEEQPPADFIQGIRDELAATLARVRDADRLPWRDLTAATLAELRFESISHWLPGPEAEALCAAFAAEMERLYAVTDGV